MSDIPLCDCKSAEDCENYHGNDKSYRCQLAEGVSRYVNGWAHTRVPRGNDEEDE
jgi:hypothetical protein